MQRISRLVTSFELSVETRADDADPINLRADLFRDDGASIYRARLWEIEPYRIQSTFPQEAGTPLHEPSDEFLLVERAHLLFDDVSEFSAATDEEAVEIVLQSIQRHWDFHGFGGEAKRDDDP